MIAIDWGTSSFRAYRVNADGAVSDKHTAELGILAVRDGKFAAALEGQIGAWLDADAGPIIMSGMIGSRQGWQEAPYAECPAGAAEIARAMVEVRWPQRRAWIAPGLRCVDAQRLPDVMRGEEVQILGALDRIPPEPSWICLPGTHSKWVRVENRRVVEFTTHMTGEFFALLKTHSILGRMMTDEGFDAEAFAQGVQRARQSGGLLHHAFGVRTLGLVNGLTSVQASAYLSGLLIGHELVAIPRLGRAELYLLGTPQLTSLYTSALQIYGVTATLLDPDAAVAGMRALAAHLPPD